MAMTPRGRRSAPRTLALLVILGAWAAPTARAQAPEEPAAHAPDEVLILDFGDEEPEAAKSSPSAFLDTLFDGTFLNELAVDTGFESPTEHVVRMKNRLDLLLSHELGADASVLVSGRLSYWIWSNEDGDTRFLFEPELRETYLRWVFPNVLDVTAGMQIYSFGAATVLSPVDQLNPVDTRESVTASLETAKIPVFGVTLRHSFGAALGITAAWIPFFFPNRIALFGDDFSLLGPDPAASPLNPPKAALSILEQVDDSIVDELQPVLLSPSKPEDEHLDNSTAALRVTSTLGGVDLGLTYIYGWDRMPVLEVDPRLPGLVGLLEPDSDPALLTEALGLFQQLQKGEVQLADLYRGHYERTHLVGFDLAATVWDLTLKAETAYSTTKVVYDETFTAHLTPVLHSMVGVDYAYETTLLVTIEADHQHLFDPPEGARLYLAEEDQVQIAGVVAVRLLPYDALQIKGAVLYGVTFEDLVVVPEVTYKLSDAYSLSAGARFFTGSTLSRGGTYDDNDEAYILSRLDF